MYVTSNVGKSIQYDSSDLIGKSIISVIPDPIRGSHYKLTSPQTASGSLYKKLDFIGLPVVMKDGYLRRLECKVLIAFDIKKGLQGLLVVVHKKNYPDENLAIIDDNGLVLETDECIRKFIHKGMMIGDCCPDLQTIFSKIQAA